MEYKLTIPVEFVFRTSTQRRGVFAKLKEDSKYPFFCYYYGNSIFIDIPVEKLDEFLTIKNNIDKNVKILVNGKQIT